jgi:hypothetical protein
MRILTLTVLGSLAVLAGCNQLITKPLTKDAAIALKPTLSTSLEQSGKALSQRRDYANSLVPAQASVQAAGTGGCNLAWNLGADADKDTIPVTGSVNLACAYTATNIDFKLGGDVFASDKDDTDATSGFRLEGKNIGYSLKLAGFSDAFNFNGVFDLTKTAAGKYDLSLTANATRNADSASHTMNLQGVSDNAATPFEAATLNGAGNTTVTYSSAVTTLKSTVTDLHYTKTCTSTGFDKGKVVWTDGTNTLSAEYTACGTVVVKYNNEAI